MWILIPDQTYGSLDVTKKQKYFSESFSLIFSGIFWSQFVNKHLHLQKGIRDQTLVVELQFGFITFSLQIIINKTKNWNDYLTNNWEIRLKRVWTYAFNSLSHTLVFNVKRNTEVDA